MPKSGAVCPSRSWTGIVRWTEQSPSGSTQAEEALGAWEGIERVLVMVTLTEASWKWEDLFLKWWRWITEWCKEQEVMAGLVLVVEKELYFEKFKEDWLLKSGWLGAGQERCEVVDFVGTPGWLGFVHPSRAEGGSWWHENSGIWTVCAELDPCS
jgi:hypothetical protein